jgi:bifunctional ADP-heptose synthase (sugar kinase/adenylyltransferase)
MKAPGKLSITDIMIAVVGRGVRVNEFGITDELAFAGGSPVDDKARHLLKELMLQQKAAEFAVATSPTTCKCVYCIDNETMLRVHEEERNREQALRRTKLQEEMDAAYIKTKKGNRGSWIYGSDGKGREI